MDDATPSFTSYLANNYGPSNFCSAVLGTPMEIDWLSRPASPSRLEQYRGPSGWTLNIGTIGSRLNCQGALPKTCIGVMLVFSAAGSSLCRSPLADGMLVTVPAGARLELSVAPGFSYVSAQVPLDSRFGAQLLKAAFASEDLQNSVRRLPTDRLEVARSRLEDVRRELRQAGDFGSAHDNAVLIMGYLEALAREVAGARAENLSRYSGNLQRVAGRARDWIHEHAGGEFRIADLCNAIGAGRRTLEYAFRVVHGVSPLEYIQARRLNLIHRQLATVDARYRSVSDVALHHGINHFGRLSANYRTLFGEYPKDTLTFARSLTGAQGSPPERIGASSDAMVSPRKLDVGEAL